MTVKEIILNAVTLLDYTEMADAITADVFNIELTKEKNILVKCVNFVNNLIATNYIPLYEVSEITNVSDEITFVNITDKTIFDFVSVVDNNNNKLDFTITPTGIKTAQGPVKIKFAYMPEEVVYTDSITEYKTKVNSRIFAYGVASEYLYIKGNSDDGEIWDNRFKDSIQSIMHSKKEAKLPKRRWI